MEIKRLHTIQDISHKWDKLSECYFQRTAFLQHLEKFNPCKQRYYTCFENGCLISAAVVYSLPVNIFSFAGIKSVIQMQVIGIPCSVSCAGIFGSELGMNALSEYIFANEKGFVLMLNRKENPEQSTHASGKTLPTIVFHNQFSDWNHYLASLKAPYRRRLNKLTAEQPELKFETFSSADFSEPMYRLYENVYKKSKAKLEKLTFDFFRNLPPEFTFFGCFHNGEIAGWNIALQDNSIYYFFLGGIDYPINKKYNTYLRLLARLVKSGIENKCRLIELGQTAEIPKTRMGGIIQPLYMQASHSDPLINAVLKKSKPLLEYSRKTEKNNPFKTTVR